ncbi:ArsR/SmtB family transcription factor [Bryobacter aggregatus]|uniref:ArsR/SmtB family transcription factor n=1 Tax=Bryobacter aggregatus TaxID=360054 RepID=UPI00068BEA2B|nr:metalloregulator ArsR/SmtB family transcription factor [Bryobacter aggregatus]
MDAQSKRDFKNSLFGEFARIGKAMASDRRLEIIDLLAQAERSVEELATETSQSVANTSQHLKVLRQAHLVETRRDGTFIRYRLADERVTRLWLMLREVGETRLAEVGRLVDTYLVDRGKLQGIDARELKRRLKDGNTVLLDVRPTVEYQAGHIAGARSIPIGELAGRLKELPKDKTIIAYCRGSYCVFADEAAALLSSRGFQAYRLDGGFPDWKIAGGAVTQTLRVENYGGKLHA